MSLGRKGIWTALVAVVCAAGLLAGAGSALAETKTFAAAGCSNWQVPSGVSQLSVAATGGAGENGGGSVEGAAGGAGGKGDELTATVQVSAHEAFDVCVDQGAGSAGGTEGPGTGFTFHGGNGGGASGLARSTDFSAPVLVAGGGGGGGGEQHGCPEEPEPGNECFSNPGEAGGSAGMAGSGSANTGGVLEGGSKSNAAGPGAGGDGETPGGGGGGGGYVGGGGGKQFGPGAGGAGGTDHCEDVAPVSGCSTNTGAGTGSGEVRITYTVPLHATATMVKCSPASLVAGGSTLCTATVKDKATSGATTPMGNVAFTTSGAGSFSKASCTLAGSGATASCSVLYKPTATTAKPERSDEIAAKYEGDATHEATEGTTMVTVFSPTALARGAFVIGNDNATVGGSVTFYEAEQWRQFNSLSGGSAPAPFKGFAESSASPPTCGEKWTSKPGSSSAPPDTVPEYMEVVVASKITKSGPTISGNVTELVVVKTSPGYSPATQGTGKVVAVVQCT
jgi:hypothetical protein